MTVAGVSPLPAGAKPVLDEARRFCPDRSLHPAVLIMEASRESADQLATKRTPSSASPIPLRLFSNGGSASSPTLAFVYGTLKRGFGNHWLMEELLAGSHARFVGFACTKRRFPLVCGPFQVPFLLRSPSPSGHHVRGELYQVDALAMSRLDELEGVSKGHYDRRPIYVQLVSAVLDAEEHARPRDAEMDMVTHENCMDESNMTEVNGLDATSLCTLAGPLSSCRMYMDPLELDEMDESLSETSQYLRAEAYFASSDYGLRMADCAPHIPCYTEKEASTYVRRKDRPHDRTFLEHVHAWIENRGLIYS